MGNVDYRVALVLIALEEDVLFHVMELMSTFMTIPIIAAHATINATLLRYAATELVSQVLVQLTVME